MNDLIPEDLRPRRRGMKALRPRDHHSRRGESAFGLDEAFDDIVDSGLQIRKSTTDGLAQGGI
jgi:hypothetical protein